MRFADRPSAGESSIDMGHGYQFIRAGALLLACILFSASSGGPKSVPVGGHPDILVISVDTLRADRLSIHGYSRETSPRIDRLMAAGAIFDQARTVEPLTAPALISMLTSLPPHRHGASRNGLRMRSGLPSLPKALAEAGYDTAAILGNWTLRDRLTDLGEHFGHYDLVLNRRRWFGLVRGEATAEDLNQRTLEYLENRGAGDEDRKPVFLWVHYVEPHAPYRLWREDADDIGLPENNLTKSDRYDSEIRFVDRQIGDLLADLEEGRHLRNPIIVFTSDHGEHNGDQGLIYKETFLNGSVRVPLLVRTPETAKSDTAGSVSDSPAEWFDIGPTLVELAGGEMKHRQDAKSLCGTVNDPKHEHRDFAVSEYDHEAMYMDRKWKLMVNAEGQPYALFDLVDDPMEIRNLINDPSSTTTISKLHKRLGGIY